jgi:hypothetical protein
MNQSMKIIVSLTVLGSLATTITLVAASVDSSKLPPASNQKGVTYAKDIKPILDKSCTRCHGGERPKARLRLDSLEGALKGSEHGPVIKAGNSAGSQIVISPARIGDEESWMPPPNNKAGIGPLTKEQVGLIRAWIDQGAK